MIDRPQSPSTPRSSLDSPSLSVRFHPLQILLQIVLAIHVSHDVIQGDNGYDGDAKLFFHLLNGRELAVLTPFLSVDQLEDTDELRLRMVGEDGDRFPDSFLQMEGARGIILQVRRARPSSIHFLTWTYS